MAKKQNKYAYYCGVRGVRFHSRGPWADAEISYKGYVFNEWAISSALWERYREDYPERPDDSSDERFTDYIRENVKEYLKDLIFFKCYDYRMAY